MEDVQKVKGEEERYVMRIISELRVSECGPTQGDERLMK